MYFCEDACTEHSIPLLHKLNLLVMNGFTKNYLALHITMRCTHSLVEIPKAIMANQIFVAMNMIEANLMHNHGKKKYVEPQHILNIKSVVAIVPKPVPLSDPDL